MRKRLTLLLVISVMTIVSLVMAQDDTIVELITTSAEQQEDAQLTILLEALSTSERLTEALDDPESELTIFAPSDEAFEKFFELAEIDVEELLAQPDIVEAILLYHVIEGALDTEAIRELIDEEVPTLLGEFATVTIEISDNEDIVIVDATDLSDIGLLEADINPTLIETDLEATNGFIHRVDEVLLPSDEMLVQYFEMLEEMEQADETDDSGDNETQDDSDSP